MSLPAQSLLGGLRSVYTSASAKQGPVLCADMVAGCGLPKESHNATQATVGKSMLLFRHALSRDGSTKAALAGLRVCALPPRRTRLQRQQSSGSPRQSMGLHE